MIKLAKVVLDGDCPKHDVCIFAIILVMYDLLFFQLISTDNFSCTDKLKNMKLGYVIGEYIVNCSFKYKIEGK